MFPHFILTFQLRPQQERASELGLDNGDLGISHPQLDTRIRQTGDATYAQSWYVAAELPLRPLRGAAVAQACESVRPPCQSNCRRCPDAHGLTRGNKAAHRLPEDVADLGVPPGWLESRRGSSRLVSPRWSMG